MKAIKYVQNQKLYMENFLRDGHCEISNNLSENFIRPYTIGKNVLFYNTVADAWTSAVIYSSLVLTAKAKALYLDVFGDRSNMDVEL